jgi:hypothetical protein
VNTLDALETARRLSELGVVVRSAELHETAKAHARFVANGGNRAMRRSTARAQKKRGRGWTSA